MPASSGALCRVRWSAWSGFSRPRLCSMHRCGPLSTLQHTPTPTIPNPPPHPRKLDQKIFGPFFLILSKLGLGGLFGPRDPFQALGDGRKPPDAQSLIEFRCKGAEIEAFLVRGPPCGDPPKKNWTNIFLNFLSKLGLGGLFWPRDPFQALGDGRKTPDAQSLSENRCKGAEIEGFLVRGPPCGDRGPGPGPGRGPGRGAH